MTVESVVLTLQVSPMDEASDELVRRSGSNPKIILRLMDTEFVEKVYTHLTTKWNLPRLELFCKGRLMHKSHLLGDYADLMSAKQSIVYQAAGEKDAVSNVSTAVPSPDRMGSIIQEIGSLANAVTSEVAKEPSKKRSRKVSSKGEQPKPIGPVNPAVEPAQSIQLVNPNWSAQSIQAVNPAQPVSPVESAQPIQSVIPVRPVEPAQSIQPAQPVEPAQSIQPAQPVEPTQSTSNPAWAANPAWPAQELPIQSSQSALISSIYKEVLDRDKALFLSVLDSQNRFFAQLQSQMTSACLEIQEKAYKNSK